MNPSTTSTTLGTSLLRTRRLVLVDGNALLHRAYHATPPLSTSKGELVNAVYGFTSMLLGALRDLQPDFVAVAWDKKAPTFRHVAFANYKANRQKTDDALLGQYDTVSRVLKSLDIPQFSLTGFEADDLVGTLTKLAEKESDLEVVVLTGDRDLMQLISSKTKVLMPKKTINDVGLYGEEEFTLKYGFAPINMVDYKGLCGDQSDNIPGVPGIGEVTATKLIQQYATLEKIYQHLEDVPERTRKLLEDGKESALMSKKLATLETEVPIRLDLAKCRIHEFDKEEARKVFEDLEFKSLINRIPGIAREENGAPRLVSPLANSAHNVSDATTKLDVQVEKVLKKMTAAGVLVDLKLLSRFGKELKRKLADIEQEIYSDIGHEFNLNSPKQLSVVLFDDLKLPVVKKTKTGRSTDESTLRELSIAHPVVSKILEYRQLFKLVSTYVDALPKHIKEDGRIHSTFNVEGAATGRISCVPIDSQILTESGWKECGELEIGEVVLGYDIIQKRYYWTQLKNIHKGKASIGLLQITNGHSATFRKGIWCTGEHRWIVVKDQVIGFAQTKNIPRKYNTILLTHSLFPDITESLLSPQEAFLLGWYLTDGFLTGKKNFGLGINVVKQRSIDLLKIRLENISHSKNKYRLPYDKSHYVTAFHISSKIFNPIYKIYINSTPSKLVLKLSRKSRESMMLAMLEGDGSMRRNKKEYDRFGALKIQKKATCEIFELLSVSLGMPYTAREYKLPGSKNIFIGYNLLKEELNSNKNSNWKEEKIEEVWCPETECGTWVMRQGNQIVITGNSQDPNLQNIPAGEGVGSDIRKVFVAAKGKILLAADYSQIELRIMAHLADDPGLRAAFQSGADIHAATAAKIFNIPLEQVTKQQRAVGKTMNFATLYGQGAHALAQQLKIDYAIARGLIEEYFEQFPKIKVWMQKTLENATKNGYAETLWGRKRFFPELQASNRMMRSFGERAAINHPVQGTAADMIKKAMVEIDEELRMYNVKCTMILQIHDELLFECDPKDVEEVGKMVKDKMENALKLSVPVLVDLKVGPNWGEMKSLKV